LDTSDGEDSRSKFAKEDRPQLKAAFNKLRSMRASNADLMLALPPQLSTCNWVSKMSQALSKFWTSK
jgi:hypothetical protein